MAEFLYQIGDVLTHKAYLVAPVPEDAPRLFVLERIAQQCPGGVQRHYVCRVMGGEDATLLHQPLNFNEAEVAPFALFAEARREEEERQRAAEELHWQRKAEAMTGKRKNPEGS